MIRFAIAILLVAPSAVSADARVAAHAPRWPASATAGPVELTLGNGSVVEGSGGTAALVFGVGTAATLAAGILLQSRGVITVGAVLTLYRYADMLRQPLERIAEQLKEFQKAMAGARRASTLLATEPAIADGPDDGSGLPAGALAVDFDGVTFSYDGRVAAVRDVDPHLAPVPLGDPTKVAIRGLRVAFHANNGVVTPTPETQAAVRAAAQVLRARGARVEERVPPDLAAFTNGWMQVAMGDGGAWVRRLLAQAGTTRGSTALAGGGSAPAGYRIQEKSRGGPRAAAALPRRSPHARAATPARRCVPCANGAAQPRRSARAPARGTAARTAAR